MNKYMPFIFVLLFLLTLLSIALYPAFSSILGIISLLFTLTLSTNAIFQKHAGTEHARAKIFKDAGAMVLTLIVVIFLGGIAAMLANAQVSLRWGEIAGLLSAIAASVLVGYLVRAGIGRFVR